MATYSYIMIEDYVNIDKLKKSFKKFQNSSPFNHCIVNNFFKHEIAQQLEKEFPDYDDNLWQGYDNPLEVKKLTNNWNHFGPLTYRVLNSLNSSAFCSLLSKLSTIDPIHSDDGLNGGGWHIHKSGGKLNPHLDYSIHPKLGLQRKLNIIIYLNSQWRETWGGDLGFWSQSKTSKSPGRLIKKIKPIFNQAVIFDTSQNSWHGMIGKIKCPKSQARKSLAVYYLTTPAKQVENRGKALFAPTQDQKKDQSILELIKKRSSIIQASSVYK